MRSSTRTPPHSQVSPSPRSPVSPPTSNTEDWSRRRFYKTMQHVFRPVRENLDSLVETPFYLYRPLSHAEFLACTEYYIQARRKEHLARLVNRQQGRPPQSPNPDRWPDLKSLGLPQDEFWKFEIPLGQLFFAETKQQQEQARRQVKILAQRGPSRARQMLKTARLKTPQAKRQFASLDLRVQKKTFWRLLTIEPSSNSYGRFYEKRQTCRETR